MADLRAVVQESWSRAVLAASSVEEQAQELAGRISQAIQGGPLSPENVQSLLVEIAGRLREHRQQLQSHIEEAVRSALDLLRSSARAELRALSERVDELERKIDRVSQPETPAG